MAADTEQVIIDIEVNYSEAIANLAKYRAEAGKLRQANAELKKEMQAGNITQDEYNLKIADNTVKIKEANASASAWERTILNSIKADRSAVESLNKMSAQVSILTQRYNALSKADRESEIGINLQKQIKSLNEEIRNTRKGLGDYRSFVGGYEEAIKSALSETGLFTAANNKLAGSLTPFKYLYQSVRQEVVDLTTAYKSNATASATMAGAQKAAAVSTNILSAALKIFRIALISTGVGAIIVALGSLVAYLTKTQKGVELLNNTLAVLKSGFDVIIDRLAMMGGALVKLLSGDFKGAASEAKSALSGIGEEMKREIKLAAELSDMMQQLEKDEVLLSMQRSAHRAEIEKLKKASEDQTKSTQERMKAAKKAYDMEQADLQKEVELRKRSVAALLGQKEVTEEVTKTMKDLADGAITADDAISKLGLSNSTIDDLKEFSEEFNKLQEIQESSYTRQTEQQNKLNTIIKEGADKAKEAKKQEQEIIRQAEDAAFAIVKEGIEKQTQAINTEYDRQIADIKTKLTTEKNLTVAAKEALNNTIISLEEQRTKKLKELSDQSLQDQIKKETERIQLQLDAVKAGSEQEHQLRVQLIEQNRQAELAANLQLAEELRQSESDINAAYNKQVADENDAFRKDQYNKQVEMLKLEWENRLLQVREGSSMEYDLKVQQAQAEYDALINMDAATKAAMFKSDAEYTNAVLQNKKKLQDATKAQINAENEAVLAQMEAASIITDAFSSMIDTFAEDNERLAAFSKSIALFNIGISTAKAIADGVASASSAQPWFMIPVAIATTLATVMANIAKAKQLVAKEKEPKYADGGEITGPSHANGGVHIEAEGGEAIINKRSMSNPLLRSIASAVNVAGGGVPFSNVPILPSSTGTIGIDQDALKQAFTEALKDMPSPVVSVVEISQVQNRVKTIENNASL